MNHTTPLLITLLQARLSAGTAADPSTTVRFDTLARTFHQSLPLGNERNGVRRRGRRAHRHKLFKKQLRLCAAAAVRCRTCLIPVRRSKSTATSAAAPASPRCSATPQEVKVRINGETKTIVFGKL